MQHVSEMGVAGVSICEDFILKQKNEIFDLKKELAEKDIIIAKLKRMLLVEQMDQIGIHKTPDECPTWIDICHCTVSTLIFNIDRAEKAEARVKELEDKVLRLGTVLAESQHKAYETILYLKGLIKKHKIGAVE